MAMGPERSKPLHNFDLPLGLKWGNQKFLRCVKVDPNGEISPLLRRSSNGGSDSIGGRRREEHEVGIEHHRRGSSDRYRNGFKESTSTGGGVGGFTRKFTGGDGGGGGGDGIAAVREKLMFDLQAEADKMKDAIFRDGLEEEVSPSPVPAPAPAPSTTVTAASVGMGTPSFAAADGGEASRPWNLRTRRAACNKAVVNGFAAGGSGGGSKAVLKVDVTKPNALSPLRTENKSPRLRSGFAAAGDSSSGDKRERVRFSVPLARREIEEDFMAMVGHRPPRRPKKRAKLVQKNLDTLFPGLWLTEITPDLYKVPDDQ